MGRAAVRKHAKTERTRRADALTPRPGSQGLGSIALFHHRGDGKRWIAVERCVALSTTQELKMLYQERLGLRARLFPDNSLAGGVIYVIPLLSKFISSGSSLVQAATLRFPTGRARFVSSATASCAAHLTPFP